VVQALVKDALARPLLDAASDLQAVQIWMRACACSLTKARLYKRESYRLLLWRQYVSRENRGATLVQMRMDDCRAFIAFLQNIPLGCGPFYC